MKLARKLALFLVLGMCLVLAIDAYFGVRREMSLLMDDIKSDEHITGRALAGAVADLWASRGKDAALRLLGDANLQVEHPYVRWVEMGSPSGSPLSPSLPRPLLGPLVSGEEVTHLAVRGETAGRFFTYIPVRVNGRIEGALEISESLDRERHHVRSTVIHRIVTTSALAALFAVLAIVLGALFVGRPMHSLVAKARRVGAGDLSGPLQLRQHDEIGELATEINAMCEQLALAQRHLAAETGARIQAIEQLRHADRLATVGKLASGMAHELGTPLNVVSQRAKMIATGEVQKDDVAHGARIIVEQTQRMTAVIRQLLDFARRHSPRKAPLDLRLLAAQTSGLLAPLAEKRRVALQVEAGDEPCVAEVDEGQIQQALTNLVMNGIQAMPRGGTLRISLHRRRVVPPADHGGAEGEYRCLEVRDEGEGIAAEHLPRLFEPFFTTKDVGEGTGLGLAVAYGIVREHDGWIAVESEIGKGSCFSIHLPLAAAAPRDERAGVVNQPGRS